MNITNSYNQPEVEMEANKQLILNATPEERAKAAKLMEVLHRNTVSDLLRYLITTAYENLPTGKIKK